MWQSTNKHDLIIEVWEKLDCESVGAAEIEAIESVVNDRFGTAAVDSPMRIARLLADEGAVLRHSEIMQLFVERYERKPYTAEFRNIVKLSDIRSSERSIRDLENLRRKFQAEGDKEGVRLVRERAIAAKRDLKTDTAAGKEAALWLTVWLQTPDAFDIWLSLRKRSPEFREQFGDK